MLEKPDAGALVDQQSVPDRENDTALEVSMKVAEAAQQVLRRSLPKLIAGQRSGPAAGSRRRARISAAAVRRTAASTGAPERAPSTIWCARSRRRFRARSPR